MSKDELREEIRRSTGRESILGAPRDFPFTLDLLAEAIYEGTPHVQNLAEKLARQYGKAGALTFYGMMGEDIQNFWKGIAKQLIDHSKEWQPNIGSGCILSDRESLRIKNLPRVGVL